MSQRVDSGKCGEWRQRLVRFCRSGQSVTAFCRDEGVSTPSFYQWRKRLQSADVAESAERTPISPPSIRVAEFTPVRLVGSPTVLVQLPGGTQVQIPTADPQALVLALRTLFQADAGAAGGAAC
jgi:transposase-like protein